MKGKAFIPIFLTVVAVAFFIVSMSIPVHVYFKPSYQDTPETGTHIEFNDTVAYLSGNLVPGVMGLFRWDVKTKYFETTPRGLQICNNGSNSLHIYVKGGQIPSEKDFTQLIKFTSSNRSNCTTIRSCGGTTFLGFYIPSEGVNVTDKIPGPSPQSYSVKMTYIEKSEGNCKSFDEKFGRNDVIALVIWSVATMCACVGCCLAWAFFKKKKSRMPRTYSKFNTFVEDRDSQYTDSDEEKQEFLDSRR